MNNTKLFTSTWSSKLGSEQVAVTASFSPTFFLAEIGFFLLWPKKGFPFLLLLPGLSLKRRLELSAARFLILFKALILLS